MHRVGKQGGAEGRPIIQPATAARGGSLGGTRQSSPRGGTAVAPAVQEPRAPGRGPQAPRGRSP